MQNYGKGRLKNYNYKKLFFNYKKLSPADRSDCDKPFEVFDIWGC